MHLCMMSKGAFKPTQQKDVTPYMGMDLQYQTQMQ